jgi:hypothetical protein
MSTEKVVFTSDRKMPHVMSAAEFESTAETFAAELCEEVERLQKEDAFTPERVAVFVRKHRLAARVLMQESGRK